MNKCSVRLVAGVVILCLVLDPLAATGFIGALPAVVAHSTPATYPVYKEQVLVSPLFSAWRRLTLGTSRIGTTWSRLLQDFSPSPTSLRDPLQISAGVAGLPDILEISPYRAVIKDLLYRASQDGTGRYVKVAVLDASRRYLIWEIIPHETNGYSIGATREGSLNRLAPIHHRGLLHNIPEPGGISIPQEDADLMLLDKIRILFIFELDQRVTQEALRLHHIGKLVLPEDVVRRQRTLSGAHWSRSRRQIYIDMNALSDAAKFRGDIHHELLERYLVLHERWMPEEAHRWLVESDNPDQVRKKWKATVDLMHSHLVKQLTPGHRTPQWVEAWNTVQLFYRELPLYLQDHDLRARGHAFEQRLNHIRITMGIPIPAIDQTKQVRPAAQVHSPERVEARSASLRAALLSRLLELRARLDAAIYKPGGHPSETRALRTAKNQLERVNREIDSSESNADYRRLDRRLNTLQMHAELLLKRLANFSSDDTGSVSPEITLIAAVLGASLAWGWMAAALIVGPVAWWGLGTGVHRRYFRRQASRSSLSHQRRISTAA